MDRVEQSEVINLLRLDSAPTGVDVEAIRRAIERLQASAARNKTLFDAVVNASPHGIIVADAEGRLILQNPAAERIWRGSATAEDVGDWGQYRAFHPDGTPYQPEDWAMSRCLSRRESTTTDEVIFQRFDGSMGVLLGSCAPLLGAQGELQGAVSVFTDITPIKRAQAQLKLITDALPVLVFNIDQSERCLFANKTYERWFGRELGENQPLRKVLGDAAYEVIRVPLRRALDGQTVQIDLSLPQFRNGARSIEATCIPHQATGGHVDSVVLLLTDVTERKRLESGREESLVRAKRMQALLEALAAAVDTADVLRATAEKGATVAQASTAAVWLRTTTGTAELVHSVGYPDEARRPLQRIDLGAAGSSPMADVLGSRGPIWVRSRPELTVRFPGFRPPTSAPECALACVPLIVAGETIGALTFTFDRVREFDVDETTSLRIVAGHAAQALQRARLFDRERQSKRAAEEAALRLEEAKSDTELLYDLADMVNRAPSLDAIFGPVLDTLASRLGLDGASVLLPDRDGVMRFRAWRGISESYREKLEGSSPWTNPSEREDATPVIVPDVRQNDELTPYHEILAAERVTGLAFIPLVHGRRVVGKFMLSSKAPRVFTEREIRLTQAIADQVAAAITEKQTQADRDRLIDELTRTVRLNELFTGILGHDLRNPLQSMLTAAELLIRKAPDPKFAATATRIVTSGTRMNRMIGQLLDFTRIRAAGTPPIERTATDIAAIWRQAIDEVAKEAVARIELRQHGETTGQWDPDRLAQVASNLTGNALRHGEKDGPVVIEIDGRDPGLVVVHVHNTGAIPEELLPKIFEPFQSGSRPSHRGDGLGLGLFITRQIVTAHGGVVDVVSSAAEGTEFTIRLPRQRAVARGEPS